jgi:predicted hydrocarbon binding protein
MNIDEIVKYINEDTSRGELAREFQGIISDYQAGTISVDEKNELVVSVVAGFEATDASSDEETIKWVATAASVVLAVV